MPLRTDEHGLARAAPEHPRPPPPARWLREFRGVTGSPPPVCAEPRSMQRMDRRRLGRLGDRTSGSGGSPRHREFGRAGPQAGRRPSVRGDRPCAQGPSGGRSAVRAGGTAHVVADHPGCVPGLAARTPNRSCVAARRRTGRPDGRRLRMGCLDRHLAAPDLGTNRSTAQRMAGASTGSSDGAAPVTSAVTSASRRASTSA